MTAVTWFISDLHLSPARPDITRLFSDFLREQVGNADTLYILGDLFDAWIGDDDTSQFVAAVEGHLKEATTAGLPIYFIAGNRDFLIGDAFCERTGVVRLDEPSCIDLYGTKTLILHGDTLCTDDVSYQRFRRFIRHPWVTNALLKLPLKWRMGIANKLRQSSKTQQPLDDYQLKIMDTNAQAVRAAFEAFQAKLMIHGHTHRPATHRETLGDGTIATRIVLGDWYEQGSMLRVTPDERELVSQPLATA